MRDGWYRLDTGFACGGILIIDNRVVDGAPIFKKMKTWPQERVQKVLDRAERDGCLLYLKEQTESERLHSLKE